MQRSILKDARYFQIVFQLTFLGYGIMVLHWHSDWWLYLAYISASFTTYGLCEIWIPKKQTAAIDFMQRLRYGWPSVLISALGLCLLLKTNHWYIAVLAAFISIASKYLLCYKGKHIFNPSALGIVTTILLTDNAWFSPGQWGSNTVLLFGVGCLGFIIVTKVQKLTVSLAFLLTYGSLLFCRQVIYLQWPIDFFIQSISTGSVLLFSFFMISDPKTTPDHPTASVVWTMVIAATAFYFSTFQFMNGTPVWVLVFAQPLVPLLDYLCKGSRFEWRMQPKAYTGPTQLQRRWL